MAQPSNASASASARRSHANSDRPPPQRGWTWAEVLDTGSQVLNFTNAAASVGFSTAKVLTSSGIEIARRATQYSLAWAPGADGSGGSGSGNSVQDYVGHFFNAVNMLAVGAVELSSTITATALGAASSGLTSISTALTSELARSLASFVRLVQRNWNHVDDSLPPGGIPQYSISQLTRALTAWVSIQLVTRPMAEARILAGLKEINIDQLNDEVKSLQLVDRQQREQQQREDAARGPTAVEDHTKARITSESRIGNDGGDVITAEIGHSHDATSASAAPAVTIAQDATAKPSEKGQTLTPAQTILAFERYARLVLGIYGGVAVRYMGVDVPPPPRPPTGGIDEEARGAGVQPPPEAPGAAPQEDHDTELKHDEADFLAAASTLDLSQTYAEVEAAGLILPGAGAGASPSSPSAAEAAQLGLDTEALYGSTAVERDHAPPGFVTPPSASAPTASASTSQQQRPSQPQQDAPSFNVLEHDQRQPMSYSLIDLIAGKHDDDVFHQLAGVERGTAEQGLYSSTARRSHGRPIPSRPKFYVVTNHAARKVVLVLRGTLSFGDVAADLTCEAVPFENMDASKPSDGSGSGGESSGAAGADGQQTGANEEEELPDAPPSSGRYHDDPNAYLVHEGMYHTALSIGGSTEAPVHRAVSRALEQNAGYDLDITGHSLGAGLASILALLWVGMPIPPPSSTDPSALTRGRTSAASGLPAGRTVHAYCFGVPCVMSAPLGRACAGFISSWTHSWDVVPRFSLGHVLDIRNAMAWMAYEERVTQPAPAAAAGGAGGAARGGSGAAESRRRGKRQRRRGGVRRRSKRGAGYAEAAAAEQQGGAEDKDAAASEEKPDVEMVDAGEDQATDKVEGEGDQGEDDDDDDGDGSDDEQDEADEPTEPASSPRPSGPPFDMTSLIKQAFAHIASAPRENAGPSSTTTFTTGFAASQAQQAQQSAYEYMASFLSRATSSASSSTTTTTTPTDPALARRQTEDAFWSLRRTLEANMRHVELYPPGDVLLTFQEGDLLRPAALGVASGAHGGQRFFVLNDHAGAGAGAGGGRGMGHRQAVFGHIVFRDGALTRHLPHVYKHTLRDVLDGSN